MTATRNEAELQVADAALRYACMVDRPEIARHALAMGADPNARDEAGLPHVNLAAARNSPRTLAALLDAGGDPNIRRGGARTRDGQDETPLHAAVMCDHEEMDVVRLLLDRGSDPNACDGQGATPLHRAVHETARGDVVALVDLLLRHGADAWVRDTNGHRPRDYATLPVRQTDEVVELLRRAEEAGVQTPADGENGPRQGPQL